MVTYVIVRVDADGSVSQVYTDIDGVQVDEYASEVTAYAELNDKIELGNLDAGLYEIMRKVY